VRRIIAVLLAMCAASTPAAADAFTVRGVEVDETAASAARSREQAIAVGQHLAAQRLLERLTLEEDRLGAPPLDAARAVRLVSGFQVEEEALAGARYIGRLTVTFDPDSVRDLLEDFNLPYVLSTARPAVVLPLWRQGEQTSLWESQNPWFEAWSIAGTVDELVPVVAPSGDLADIAAIDASRALALDSAALQALASNYSSAHVLVALASPSTSEGLVSARIVGVDFAHGGASTDYGMIGPGEPVEVARAAAALLQDSWKRTMSVREPFLTTATVSALFRSVDDWMALQAVIGAEPLVQLARLDALTNDGALMTIEHRGTLEQLTLVMREHGVELTEVQGGLVATRVADAAGISQGR
jgi:hypothetical protein